MPPSPARSTARARRADGYTLMEVALVLAILAALAGISWPVLMRPWSRSVVQQAAQEFTGQLLEARRRAVEESRVYRLRWQDGRGGFELVAPAANREDQQPANDALRSAIPDRLPQSDTAAANQSPGRIPGEAAVDVDRSQRGDTLASQLPPPRPVQPMAVAGNLLNDVTFGPPPELAMADTEPGEGPADSPLAAEPGEADSGEATRMRPSSDLAADPLAPVEIAWSQPVWFYPDGRCSNGHWTLVSQDGYEIDVYLRGLTGTIRVGPVRRRLLPEDTWNTDDALGTPDAQPTPSQSAPVTTNSATSP